MDEKAPCRWLVSIDDDYDWRKCGHPVMLHHEYVEMAHGHAAFCRGCPCHEPEPAKDTPGCQWEQDWEGNWEASCSLYWVGDDIGGMNFCPNCGLPVAAVPYTEPKEDDDAVATD